MPGSVETDKGRRDGDWQNRSTIADCNRHMLEQQIATDVTFHLGEAREEVRAHKYMLVSRSPVFHAMFCGPLATEDSVDIPDIDAATFQAMLRFLYCEELELSADSVMAVLYAGKKYGLLGLVRRCVAFLEEALDLDTMFVILEQAHQFDETELRATVLKYAMDHAERVLAAPEFTDLCQQCLEDVISCDQLRAREESVLKGAVRWGERSCVKRGLEISEENLRLVLGAALYHVRFPALDMVAFAKDFRDSKLLTDAEKVKILSHHINPALPVEPFNPRERENKEMLHLIRFSSTNNTKWDCLKGSDAIALSVDKPITLYGVVIYGAFQSPSTGVPLKVAYIIYGPEEEILGRGKQALTSREGKLQYDVFFEESVPLAPHVTYTLSCSVRGEKTYHGAAGKGKIEKSGVTFVISSTDKCTTGTDSHRGQIPGFIFAHGPDRGC